MRDDKVIERRQASWMCDQCRITESVAYDATMGYPPLEQPELELTKDWRAVSMRIFIGIGKAEATYLDFCSEECETTYFERVRGTSHSFGRTEEKV